MTIEAVSAGPVRGRIRAMRPRSPHEAHRTATPLELLFDLVFVVAIAEAGQGLHHAIAAAHPLEGLVGYLMVFFAIWWAWMNFTWFASAYDCDDVAYRLAAFVQIAGALIVAAGVPAMFESRTPNVATVGGYVIMRLALVGQWLRAAASDADHRRTALRYAAGITALQIAWVSMMFFPSWWGPGFVTFAILELVVPVWAEGAKATTWHPHHIAERYGLFTLIVLGESILAATMAVQSALSAGEAVGVLLPISGGGLLIVCAMWWMYFDRPVHDLLTSLPKAIVWGYGHYFVFAAAAAVGAGLAVAVDFATGHAKVSAAGAGLAVAVPVAVFLMCLWSLHHRPAYRGTRWVGPVASALVLLAPLSGRHAVLVIGLILAGAVAVKVAVHGAGTRQSSASG